MIQALRLSYKPSGAIVVQSALSRLKARSVPEVSWDMSMPSEEKWSDLRIKPGLIGTGTAGRN